jgi:hypothetical protein
VDCCNNICVYLHDFYYYSHVKLDVLQLQKTYSSFSYYSSYLLTIFTSSLYATNQNKKTALQKIKTAKKGHPQKDEGICFKKTAVNINARITPAQIIDPSEDIKT